MQDRWQARGSDRHWAALGKYLNLNLSLVQCTATITKGPAQLENDNIDEGGFKCLCYLDLYPNLQLRSMITL